MSIRAWRAVAAVCLVAATACSTAPSQPSPQASTAPSPPPVQASSPAPSATATAPGAASSAPADEPDLSAVRLAAEPLVELDAPTALAARPGDRGLYIAERGGRIVRVEGTTVADEPVLDISSETTTDGERGLLGLTFSPDGDRLYVSYTNRNGDSRVDEYEMGDTTAAAGSRRNLLQVAQPYPNHNGGNVATGPDGLLYFGLGDGGAAGDPHGHGQDPTTLLGSMLRIDPEPSDDAPYSIPDDNPFADGDGGRPEVWIYGLRNPWRFSFDRETDDLWIGDVGQQALEEIDLLPFEDAGGTNLGWSVFEGTQRYASGTLPDAVPPIFEYPHDGRCSVTGGYVYRGRQIADLRGAYLYGDLCDGIIRALVAEGGTVVDRREFDVEVPELASFGEDAAGELYALSLSGTVYRLVTAN